MPKIIIAYSDQDDAFAQGVRTHLEAHGFEISSSNADKLDDDSATYLACVLIASRSSIGPGPPRKLAELASSLGVAVVVLPRKQEAALRQELETLKQNHEWLTSAHHIMPGIRAAMLQSLVQIINDVRHSQSAHPEPDGAVSDETVSSMTNGPTMTNGSVDITKREDLIRYVIRTQLYQIGASVETMAANEADEAELRSFLEGNGSLSLEMVRGLNDTIVAMGHAQGILHVGGVAQYAARMRDSGGASGYTKAPPDWTTDELRADSDNEVHVLVLASALINKFAVAERVGVASFTIREHYTRAITEVVDRLILLASGLQNARYIEAQLMLAGLAKYAFEIVFDRLARSIRNSALGFRTWRSVSRLLAIARTIEKSGSDRDLFLVQKVRIGLLQLLRDSPALRRKSVYPGRALDVECFLAIPWHWGATDTGDAVTDVLLSRAMDERATLRERGTAAMGLWQRAFDNGHADDPVVRNYLEDLIEALENSSVADDIDNGLKWVAATLRKAMQDNVAVCAVLPEADDQPWYQAVQHACSDLGLGMPDSVVVPTKELFRQALLQNAGVERRRAIDALRAGGLVDTVAHQLFYLLRDPRAETWLRIRVLFALGFIQARTEGAQDEFVAACRKAAQAVIKGAPSRAEITELQEALFAIADVFGVTGAEEQSVVARARAVRDRLAGILEELVGGGHTVEPGKGAIARAVAYLLVFTAQPGENDLSRRLLSVLADHRDEVTAELCAWALHFRWGPDHSVRPLLHGVP